MKANFLLAFILLASCTACKPKIDLSPEAYASGDFTLVASLAGGPCAAIPVQGADLCRFKEGSQIASSWRIVVPSSKYIVGGQVTVYFKDTTKTYPLTGNIIEIPLRDLIGHDRWQKSDSRVATALAEIRWKDADGVLRTGRAEGVAMLIVLKSGYDPMPIDSGVHTWSKDFKCKVQYSSAGRSAVECK